MNDITFDETPAITPTNTIGESLRSLLADPSQFIRNWNYKGAILSGVMRAPIFLATYLIRKEALWVAIGAASVQFVFRFIFAGVSGTLIQRFRHVEPPWKAVTAVLLVVPFVSHVFEFFIQFSFGYFTDTKHLTDDAILRSICFSVISAWFTLFAMRRGVMIVGDEGSHSLFADLKRLPRVIFHFGAFIPNEIHYMLRRGAFLGAGIAVALFGLVSQLILWAVTNRGSWTYGNGKELGVFKYWGVDGIALLVFAIIVASIVNTVVTQGQE